MNLTDKLQEIYNIMQEIDADDKAVGSVLLEGFGLSLNILKEMSNNGGQPRGNDVAEHIDIITRLLGIPLEDVVKSVLEQNFGPTDSTKEPDQETMDFITSDLDDYERFLAQNKAKGDLDFLSKEL